jgi:hypothetical protein
LLSRKVRRLRILKGGEMIKIIKKINTRESKNLLINNLSKIENAFKGKKVKFSNIKE